LRLAREFSLPLIVHARRAVDAVIAAIRRVGGIRGVVHSFSGSSQQAAQLWELGFMIGLGGPVTYERANRLRALARTMPLEHLLLETDAPDQPDSGHRGQRNEPARIINVLQAIAELRGMDPQDIADATSANAERLFRLPAP
jgi:TatD DNase family protein